MKILVSGATGFVGQEPAPLSKVFDFFSSVHNLERITPPWLNFQVLTPADQKIEAGSLIDYRLRIHGVSVKWRTLIESWDPGRSFVDTQLRGPYKKWHHTHRFEELQGGVLIEDRVLYRVPFFFVGEAFGGAWVRRDVERIFQYRKKIIREIFAR
jgi:ligand-binding SRPBCC domain-containing protein